MKLSPEQTDVLSEAFNIAVGRAAAALAEIAGGDLEVALSVPDVSIVEVGVLAESIKASCGDELCAVTQHYAGPFKGRVVLVYSYAESLELVRLMLGEDEVRSDFSEMEADALREVGNIVLSACLGTIANLFDIEIETDIPDIQNDTALNLLSNFGARSASELILYLRMDFRVDSHQLGGHLGFSMEIEAMEGLMRCVDDYVTRLLG